MSFISICEFKARDESEFERLARALAAAATTEPGTLRYQWYVAPQPGHFKIVEEYVDADAAEAHNGHVALLLGKLFAVAELVSAQLFGELNAYLRGWASSHDGITVYTAL